MLDVCSEYSVVAKPKGPKCSICKSYVGITVNPWQRTRGYARLAIAHLRQQQTPWLAFPVS